MGSAVDPQNLDRELVRYQAAGLGGVEVTHIYGVKGWKDREIPYLSPKWMEMLDHAIKSAVSLGMETDMTTGTGWCLGGPTVSPADANASIVARTQDLQPGASLTGTFDPVSTQALVAFSPNSKPIDLTRRIGPDGRVDWTADGGPWRVYAISQKPSGQMVKRSAPGGAGPMLNPFYPDAITRYMQWFQKPFADTFPSGPSAGYRPHLNALFQDSYEYNSNWSPDFLAQFQKLRGYPLQTELPALLGSAQDDHTARVKSDYRETISDILTLESMPIWVRWAHAHFSRARYQAHGDPGNLLDLYAIADIPETEMFHLARNILVSKFASSAAHVAGKPLAGAETGTWLSEHFTETLAEMKNLVDDMFLAGINHVIYHGTAYSPDEAPWPGWCFYASTEMNPRNSIWRDVPTLNAYITRSQSILQSGSSDNDVLLYWPIYDRWSDPQGMVQNFDILGNWFDTQPIGKTAQRLWDRGFSFDYISDRQLLNIKLDHGHLVLSGSRYRAIVIPPSHLMPVATMTQLVALARQGIPVIFDTKLPDDVPGLADLDNRRRQLQSILHGITGAVSGQSAPVLSSDIEEALADSGVHREQMTDHPGVHYVRRSSPAGLDYFIANLGNQPLNDWVTLSTHARSIAVMDPMTGQTGLASIRAADSTHTQLRLQLDPGQSIVLRTFSEAESGPAWPVRETTTSIPLTGTWSVKFLSGGPALPAPYQTGTLTSWATEPDAQAFAGTALYSLTFDAPPSFNLHAPFSIDLGNVAQSARVRLNGKPLGTLIIPPWRVEATSLLPKANLLEVEVTNVSANRIRDMDIRKVPWKIFDPPDILSINYKPFNAAGWPLTDSGLLGPVTLDTQSSQK